MTWLMSDKIAYLHAFHTKRDHTLEDIIKEQAHKQYSEFVLEYRSVSTSASTPSANCTSSLASVAHAHSCGVYSLSEVCKQLLMATVGDKISAAPDIMVRCCQCVFARGVLLSVCVRLSVCTVGDDITFCILWLSVPVHSGTLKHFVSAIDS